MLALLSRISDRHPRVPLARRALPSSRAALALCAVCVAAGGCGATTRDRASVQPVVGSPAAVRVRGHRTLASLAPQRRALVRGVLARAIYEVDHPDRAVPPYRRRGTVVNAEHLRSPDRALTRPVASPVPVASGLLERTFRVRFRGGSWLVPRGERAASGGGIITFERLSRVCWRFSGVSGLDRPRLVELFRGTIAPGTKTVESPVMLLGSWSSRGCVDGVNANELAQIERRPHAYVVGISDAVDAIAAGGQL